MKSVRPNKLLGQHFLTCEWVPPVMAQAAELTRNDTVLEIGPGTAVLTRFLATRVKKVIAVEKDRALAKDLTDEFAVDSKHVSDDRQKFVKNQPYTRGDIEIIASDILHFDFSVLPKPYKVVANIPYYLTSRLIRILLELEKKPDIIVLTIQREVAKRAAAHPPDMNMLAVAVHAYSTPKIVATVPTSCFTPMPKVDSAILKISGISEDFFTQHHIAPKDFFAFVRAGFSSRRKVLANNLERFALKEELAKALISIGHTSTARAQELSLESWAKLARLFVNRRYITKIPNR